jgi:secreted trypsin-like serine protease
MPIALFSGTATAITGHYTDDTTSYVGIVVLFNADAEPIGYCSGFLISSRIMLTAGHSLIGVTDVGVCFDQDPSSSIENGKIIYSDTFEVYPGYDSTLVGNQEFQTSDIGAIIFKNPIKGVGHANLPTPGLIESLRAKTDLTIVGFGMQNQATPKNSDPQNSWTGTVTRNSAQVEFVPSSFCGSDLYLKLTANPSQDKGAICFGDSGGPVIYDGKVVGLNAFVSSSNCDGVSYHTRLDEPDVLKWINEYLLS